MNRKAGSGEKVFVVESNRIVREATVLKNDDEFILVRLSGMEGAIRLRANRLYETREEAVKSLPPIIREQNPVHRHRLAYDGGL